MLWYADSTLQTVLRTHYFCFSAPLSNGEGKEKEEEIESKEFSKLKEAFSTLQSEQEDLLMMLSEQDVKLRSYKKIIKGLWWLFWIAKFDILNRQYYEQTFSFTL